MESIFQYHAPPSPCGYLPGQTWRLEYEVVGQATAAEYLQRMQRGWRRFGHTLFRPQCPRCTACRSLRVPVDQFVPNRSQRRAWKANAEDVRLTIGDPAVSREKLDLYDRFHAFQTDTKGWPGHDPKDAGEYTQSFVENPFPTREWCYYLDGRLVAVGYVDDLPGGMSAIYFYYDPDLRPRSLGTYNVLCLLEHARRRRVPYVYLGFFVEGCPSLAYKANFRPNQTVDGRGVWSDFRE
jgi:arginine-tRNA-protein transferase